MILNENNDLLLGWNSEYSSGGKVLKAETTSTRHCFYSSWWKYGFYCTFYQYPTSSQPQWEKGQDWFTTIHGVNLVFIPKTQSKYSRVKLKVFILHEAKLNPILDILPRKRQVTGIKEEHKEMKLPMYHMLTLWIQDEPALASKQQGM